MKDVKSSSNIDAFGHKDGTLTIRFKGGATYDYPDFPADARIEDFGHVGSSWLKRVFKPAEPATAGRRPRRDGPPGRSTGGDEGDRRADLERVPKSGNRFSE